MNYITEKKSDFCMYIACLDLSMLLIFRYITFDKKTFIKFLVKAKIAIDKQTL